MATWFIIGLEKTLQFTIEKLKLYRYRPATRLKNCLPAILFTPAVAVPTIIMNYGFIGYNDLNSDKN